MNDQAGIQELTVILKDTSKLRHGQVGQGRANGLESGVIWDENGEVLGRVNGVGQVGLHKSTSGVA